MRVIIAAAGTAGHINPGIAIANKIKKENEKSEILFIGTDRGLEKDLITRAGYKLKTIDAYGLSKSISITNFKNMLKTFKSGSVAKKIINEFKPDIIIGTGGYICGPVIIAGKKLGIPAILHESNAFPGKAVRVLSKKVDKILLGFEEAEKKLEDVKEKLVVTGTPVDIKDLNLTENQKEQKIKKLTLNTYSPIVLVFGGSQGAKKINETMMDIVRKKMNVNYQIIWSTGNKQYDEVKKALEKEDIDIENLNGIRVFPYIYNMEEIMNISDIIVCRSGAMTVTEISKLGKAAIFIPLPNVSENHQEYNARVLEKVGAARVILNDELSAEKLNDNLSDILSSKANLYQMGVNAKMQNISNVETKIYDEIEKIVGEK